MGDELPYQSVLCTSCIGMKTKSKPTGVLQYWVRVGRFSANPLLVPFWMAWDWPGKWNIQSNMMKILIDYGYLLQSQDDKQQGTDSLRSAYRWIFSSYITEICGLYAASPPPSQHFPVIISGHLQHWDIIWNSLDVLHCEKSLGGTSFIQRIFSRVTSKLVYVISKHL